MMKKQKWLGVLCLAFFSQSVSAWEAHYLLTYAALKDMPEIAHATHIGAETLDSFVQQEKDGLVKLLQKIERWSTKRVASYPQAPKKIQFAPSAEKKESVAKQFLLAIRVNPDLTYPLFLLYPNGVKHRISNPLSKAETMMPPLAELATLRVTNPPVEKVNPGQEVSALEILTSAAEEPDYGLDVGVWQDNQTWYGKLYGLGNQPFGNPQLIFSSQAPFHMGFYFESPVLYKAAGFLSRCYPEYRIHLYLTLSRYAMATGHPYWGYRFLGWALHYVQDLAQPYHAKAAPGVGTAKLLALNALQLIGFSRPADNLKQLITNRHFAIENFQFENFDMAFSDQSSKNILMQAIGDLEHDKKYPPYNHFYPRSIVAAESYAAADKVDELIAQAFPRHTVWDPEYIFYDTDPKINLLETTKTRVNPAVKNLNTAFLTLIRATGSHTRNTIRYVLRSQPSSVAKL